MGQPGKSKTNADRKARLKRALKANLQRRKRAGQVDDTHNAPNTTTAEGASAGDAGHEEQT